MPYEFLEDVSIADVAFRAEGKDLEEVFKLAAEALTCTMVKDLNTIEKTVIRNVSLTSEDLEMLLFNFLQELVYYKDAEQLIFGSYKIAITENVDGRASLRAEFEGERLDMKKHELIADVKAVTMHLFSLKNVGNLWVAFVVLDV